MPLTQAELGDALGLSTVHVNRTLQELRHNGLIKTQGGKVIIDDWDALRAAGEFDPTYLHLKSRRRAPGRRRRNGRTPEVGKAASACPPFSRQFCQRGAEPFRLVRVQSARPNEEAR
jgi:DNA-binding transcriptional regulator LsrR (DeoR family)